jgi:hypothetical protein
MGTRCLSVDFWRKDEAAVHDARDGAARPVHPGLWQCEQRKSGFRAIPDDDSYDYWDDHLVRDYGRAAGTLDRQAIVGLVRRYFAVALAGDGVVACSMLSSKLAKQADLAAAVPRDYVSPDVSALRGKPCSQFMSLLFGQAHEQLAYADVASLEVTVVRVQGDRGLAVLAFRTASERYIPLQREHGTWKIDAPLDGEIP